MPPPESVIKIDTRHVEMTALGEKIRKSKQDVKELMDAIHQLSIVSSELPRTPALQSVP